MKPHDEKDTDGSWQAGHHTLGPRRTQGTPGHHRHLKQPEVEGTIPEGQFCQPLFDSHTDIIPVDGTNTQKLNTLFAILENYGLAIGDVVIEDEGGGTSDLSHEYNFASASYDWTIDHGLGTYLIEVSAFDSAGEIEYFPEIEYTSSNQVVIHWYYPTAGLARIVG